MWITYDAAGAFDGFGDDEWVCGRVVAGFGDDECVLVPADVECVALGLAERAPLADAATWGAVLVDGADVAVAVSDGLGARSRAALELPPPPLHADSTTGAASASNQRRRSMK